MPQVCPQCRAPVQQVGKFFVCPEHGPVEPAEFAASMTDSAFLSDPVVGLFAGKDKQRPMFSEPNEP